MTERAYKDPEFGIVILRKNARSRAISIRVRESYFGYGSMERILPRRNQLHGKEAGLDPGGAETAGFEGG